MGFFDEVGDVGDFLSGGIEGIAGFSTTPLQGLVGGLTGKKGQEKATQEQLDREAYLRRIGKEKQLQLIGGLKAPQTTPEMAARIAALEEESKPIPLAQDPRFQAQRARLLTGGARELSSIQNTQRGAGIQRGGFSNVGSLQDVQDRLGVALAALGQKQIESREQKRDTAAEARQNIMDAQINFENARSQALAAIEGGDTQSAIAALNKAYEARQKIAENQQKFLGGLLSAGAQAAAAAG